jgi:hypothetical protein
MVPGGIVFASFISRHDAANPENQVNAERQHRLSLGPDFENAWNDLIDDVCKEHHTLSSRCTNFFMKQN